MVKVQNITVLPEKISNFVCNYKLKKSVYDKERDERFFASCWFATEKVVQWRKKETMLRRKK
jgi:hypothetical protein